MRTISIFALTAATLTIASCVAVRAPVALASDSATQLKGQTLAISAVNTPSFFASSAGKAAFALLGAAAAISEGNQLVKNNTVADPAVFMGQEIASAIGTKYGTSKTSPSRAATGDSVEDLIKAAPSADLILDVQTSNWAFGYFPTDWTHYHVRYGANARLIDVKARKVVAQGHCRTPARPEHANDAPTYDGLVGDGAKRLKQELLRISQTCIAQFKTEMNL